jgi:aminoglycoside 6'-N-acetyltransferase
VTLTGSRVTLRPVSESDLPRLVEILRHPKVRRWWGDYDEDRLRAEYLSADSRETAFAILDAGEVVGIVSYWEEPEPDYRHAGMDIAVAAELHGHGIGTDALRTLARHLIDDRGHHRLVIDPALANQRAIRAYERVGFRRVGVMRRAERSPEGTWRDALLMEVLADELTAPET